MQVQNNIHISNFITLKAVAGKETELAQFLMGGAQAVSATEPQTRSWYAVQIDQNTFAIIDFFTDQAGQDAHVNGQVAAALKSKADELIVGGWENGVLKNFEVYKVLSAAT